MAEDEIIALEDLVLDPGNARVHDDYNLRLIADSITEFGGGRSIVLGPDNRLVAGEGTVEGAKRSGKIKRVRIIDEQPDEIIALRRADWTPLQAVRYGLMDNKTTDTSRYNEEVLMELVQNNQQALLGIFSDSEQMHFQQMIEIRREQARKKAENSEETKQERAQQAWGTKMGQVWALPSLTMPDRYHVVMCGDARDHSDWLTLMQGKKANGVFTSPPYAEQRGETYDSIPADKYLDWFRNVEANVRHSLAPDGSFFINIKEHVDNGERHTYVMELVLWLAKQLARELGNDHLWWWIDTDCWRRPGMPGKQGPRFKNAWEPVYHFALQREPKWRPENVMDLDADLSDATSYQGAAGNVILGRPDYDGAQKGRKGTLRAYSDGAMPDNVIDVNKGFTENPGHGARFPIGLPEFFIRAYSDPLDLWVDPFVGSGSTMLAGEKCHRIVFGMDNDPKAVAVVLNQFADLGVEPQLITEGYEG